MFEMTNRMHDSSDEMVMTSMYLEKRDVPNPSQIGPIWDGFGTDLGGQFRPLNMAEKDIL